MPCVKEDPMSTRDKDDPFVVHGLAGAGFLFLFLLGTAGGASRNGIVRRPRTSTARRCYMSAGQGPVVILLHGYAETSMWRPIIPLLAKHFRVIAPDLPGIGDSSIPADGLDMKSAAVRIHALARSLNVDKARVVGHDIGLMVAYAYAAQFPAETEKLVLMDAFLPGVAGWEAIYNNPGIWHFRFNGPTPEKRSQDASASTSSTSERLRRRQEPLHSGGGAAGLRGGLFGRAHAAGRLGVFRFLSKAATDFAALAGRSMPVLAIGGDKANGQALGEPGRARGFRRGGCRSEEHGTLAMEEIPTKRPAR
jgi:pimeloyl-ACP methyl ester carboxylesterase